MLTRSLSTPVLRIGGAEVSLSRYLASRGVKTATGMVGTIAKRLPDTAPAKVIEALREMRGVVREAVALIRACAEAGKSLSAAARALETGEADGASPLIGVALETRASLAFIRAAVPDADETEAEETAEHLRAVAHLVAEDVSTARKRLAMVQDLLAEAVDTALSLEGTDATAILSEFTPTPRLQSAMKRQRALLPEHIRSVARLTLGEKRKEVADKRLAQRAEARRELESAAQDAWGNA